MMFFFLPVRLGVMRVAYGFGFTTANHVRYKKMRKGADGCSS